MNKIIITDNYGETIEAEWDDTRFIIRQRTKGIFPDQPRDWRNIILNPREAEKLMHFLSTETARLIHEGKMY